MEISIVTCLFVLDSQRNTNNKRNDIKTLKVVVNKNNKELIRTSFNSDESMKDGLRKYIKSIIGSDKFHLEQVYTVGEKKFYDDNKIDVVYMALTNGDNIKKLDDNFELIDFSVIDNKEIIFADNNYKYKTDRKVIAGSLEYNFVIDINDLVIEKKLIELMTVYKHLRFRMDNTDVCFKLLPDKFTLEDVRIVYELVKGVTVDKSNFRKKIIKYCEKVDMVVDDKGYRPSQMFKFNPDSVDTWL